MTGPRSSVWSIRDTPIRSRSDGPGRPSKRSSRAKAAARVVRDEVVAAVAAEPRPVAAAGVAARVEVAAAEEAAAAPVVPAVVATVAVADLLVAIGDEGATSGRSTPRRRAISSSCVLGARILVTKRAHAHRTRRCWRWN